ncbi:MAG: UbiX family flavin prenyltransferase [Phycisphaerales bacterium]|nr:UbiX family flavin prenyltransferase [Phycisphaerales bacterium]
MQNRRVVIGITGASGAPYALRAIELLAAAGVDVHVAATTMGRRLLVEECAVKRLEPEALVRDQAVAGKVHVHRDSDMGECIASGSFLHDGMAIVPCSSNTLGHLAAGMTNSLVHRAAAVCLKEGRRLVLAHRETPLSRIDLANMDRLAGAGAVIMPLTPGFYHLPKTIDDLVDFMAARTMDQLGVHHDLDLRWEGSHKSPGLTGRPDRPDDCAVNPAAD